MSPLEFAFLVDKYGPALILYARQWAPAPEDVVQEAFLKLLRLRVDPREVVPWLYRVVRNAAMDAGKANRRRQHREQAVARPESWFLETAVHGFDASAAIDALKHLPGEQREIIVARLWGGLSFEQMGETVGCSATTAFRRYSAGIETLRKELGAPCRNSSPNS